MSQMLKDINLITRCGAAYRDKLVASMGLSAYNARLIMEVCATPGVSQDTIARRVFVNKSVVARSMAALEEQGLVERPNDPKDKRVIRLYPTDKALKLQHRIQVVWTDCELYLTEGFTEEEVAILEDLLSRMKNQVRKLVETER